MDWNLTWEMYFAGVKPFRSREMIHHSCPFQARPFRTFTKFPVTLSLLQFSLKILIHLMFKMHDIVTFHRLFSDN